MAHFYGTVQGGRGQATRLGHKTTGMYVTASTWEQTVTVQLSVHNDVDWCSVSVNRLTLYDGPLADMTDLGKVYAPIAKRLVQAA